MKAILLFFVLLCSFGNIHGQSDVTSYKYSRFKVSISPQGDTLIQTIETYVDDTLNLTVGKDFSLLAVLKCRWIEGLSKIENGTVSTTGGETFLNGDIYINERKLPIGFRWQVGTNVCRFFFFEENGDITIVQYHEP